MLPQTTEVEADQGSCKDKLPSYSFPQSLPQLAAVEGVSSDWLSSQLIKVQKAIETNESLRGRLVSSQGINDKDDDDGPEIASGIVGGGTDDVNVLQRLSELEGEVESLSLAADFAACRRNMDISVPSTLDAEMRQCVAFAEVLTRHEPSPAGSSSLYRVLLDRYQQLHKYVRARAILSVRRALRKVNYPVAAGCDTLSDELAAVAEKRDDAQEETFVMAAAALTKLQLMHDHLMHHIGHYDNTSHIQKLDLIDELCRPIVKRVCYHFIDEGIEGDPHFNVEMKSAQRPRGEPLRNTGNRLDCLPQWLFHYMKDVISEGAYGFLREDLQPLISRWMEELWKEVSENANNEQSSTVASWHEYEVSTSYFLSEMVKVSQHVLQARNFFTDPSIVGEDASPINLSNAVEQLLVFDSFISKLLADEEAYPSSKSRDPHALSSSGEANRTRSGTMPVRPPRLLDIFVASNEIMMGWWVLTDKHYMLSTLAGTTHGGATEAVDNFMVGKLPISPTAETFLSLLHSARTKAEAIGFPDGRRTYVAQAIVPLCMQFMDLMHEHASTMRDLLVQRKKGGAPPTDEDLTKNFLCWIEIVTGTHLAAAALLHGRSGDVVTLGADEDLARVGRSLERLRDAMVDECGSSFVETILSERAKLASYLMRCPHMLSSRSAVPEDQLSLSPDLNEVAHILSTVLDICNRVVKDIDQAFGPAQKHHGKQYSDMLGGQEKKPSSSLEFAPKVIKANIARRLEEKLLEVALDIHDMIPVVGLGGAHQFQYDMQVLVDSFGYHGPFDSDSASLGNFARLVDVTAFMALQDNKFASMRDALLGLVHSSEAVAMDAEFSEDQLRYEAFEADGTLLEQAKSMLDAKGFSMVEVEDAISVINRRKL